MNIRLLFIVLAAALTGLVLAGAQASVVNDAPTPAQIAQFASHATAVDAELATALDVPDKLTDPPDGHFKKVKPHRYDPADTDTVQAKWLNGVGCQNAAATNNTTNPGAFTDTACAVAYDPDDEENAGLLLAKSGSSFTGNSHAFAELKNVKGISAFPLELGFDIKKFGNANTPQGSHCGPFNPYFDVLTTDGLHHLVGCGGPASVATITGAAGTGDAWTRMRSDPAVAFAIPPDSYPFVMGETVERILLVFDSGTDQPADYFGTAFLDNIDVAGQLVGKK
jgi:hypothetical protein